MALPAELSRRLQLALRRLRGLVFVLVIACGFAVAALERWRPASIEPMRRPIFNLLETYLGPTQSFMRRGRDAATRTGRLWEVETDYEKLRERLIVAEAELQAAREQLRRLGRISGLRQWESPAELEFVLADVTGFSTEDLKAELFINRGRADGLETGLPVVGQRGLVGVVREVAERSARVQALPDYLSAVGVTETDSRARGIVFGRGRDSPLEFIPENQVQPVRAGTVLITSGFRNSVYPKGLVVGTIKARRFNERDVEYGVVLAAEYFGALEEVLVIRRAGPATAGADEGLGTFTLDMPTTATLAGEAERP